MLTPRDIEEKTFEKSIMGYKPDDVDQFLDTITEDFKSLYVENAELTKKINILVEKIDEYRKDEEYLRSAILNAQKLSDIASREAAIKADDIIKEAERNASQLENEAKKKYEASISENEENIKREQAELDRIKKEVSDFKNRLINMYKTHIELITALPSVEKEEEKTVTPEPENVSLPDVKTEAAKDNEIDVKAEPQDKAEAIEKTVPHEEPEGDEIPMTKFNKIKFGIDYDISKD